MTKSEICYGIGSTAQRVKTACGKRIKYTTPWTTAAGRVTHPDCLASDAWATREGRFGIGDATVQVPDEIAMHPVEKGTRFRTRKQKQPSNPTEEQNESSK